MTEMDLLRAVNEIDEEWIIEAAPKASGSTIVPVSGGNSRKKRVFRRTAAIIGAAAAAAAVLFISVPLLKNKDEKRYTEVAEIEDNGGATFLGGRPPMADEAEETADALEAGRNPFTEYESLEAAENAGFLITVPESFAESKRRVIRCADFGMMEIIYENADGDELIRIRKQEGSDDISGDYSEYAFNDSIECSGCSVDVSGEDSDAICRAVWENGDYSYAIIAGVHLLSGEDVAELVKEVL